MVSTLTKARSSDLYHFDAFTPLSLVQDESFQAFLQRPENRVLVETYQRKEAINALKAKERATALEFRQKVSSLGP